MKQNIPCEIVFGDGLIQVQVMTKTIKHRPFPAMTGLCLIEDDGTFLGNSKQMQGFRAEIIAQLRKERGEGTEPPPKPAHESKKKAKPKTKVKPVKKTRKHREDDGMANLERLTRLN